MIVYAINVHTGGGKILLDELLTNEPFGKISALFHDERYVPPSKTTFDKIPIRSTLFHRFKAEVRLKGFTKKEDEILMFGNLPPLFKLESKVILFLQNVFLFPKIQINMFPLKIRLRLFVERLWLLCFKKNITEVWVQGKHVENLARQIFSPGIIKIQPILPKYLQGPSEAKKDQHKHYDFIYVTSLDPHKNIDLLIRSWEKMNSGGLRPKLLLVVNKLSKQMKETQPYLNSLNIEIRHDLSREEVILAYQSSHSLIFPSRQESFGLPLYEARKYGLKIVASDLPYAHEPGFVDYFFNPNSVDDLIDKVQKLMQDKLELSRLL